MSQMEAGKIRQARARILTNLANLEQFRSPKLLSSLPNKLLPKLEWSLTTAILMMDLMTLEKLKSRRHEPT